MDIILVTNQIYMKPQNQISRRFTVLAVRIDLVFKKMHTQTTVQVLDKHGQILKKERLETHKTRL